MSESLYQQLKLSILDVVPLGKDAAHIYVGFVVLFAVIVFRPRLRHSYWAVLPGVLVAIGLEIIDLRDDYLSLGAPRWWASLKDVVNTNLLPLVTVHVFRWSGRRGENRDT
jgi:hypothetical protein